MPTDQKRSETPYGTVEYDTIQCAECTNDTVTGELTHLLDTTVANLQSDAPDPAGVRPICYGCLEEWYNFDITGSGTAALSHNTLCGFYVGERQDLDMFSTVWYGLQLAETTHPTPHGQVSITVAQCARCGDERSINDLCVAGLPTAINSSSNQLRIDACYYCPDCRETSLLALQSDGPTFATVVENGGFEKWNRSGSILRIDGFDVDSDDPWTWLKTGGGVFLGGVLLTMVFMAAGLDLLGIFTWMITIFVTLFCLGGASWHSEFCRHIW